MRIHYAHEFKADVPMTSSRTAILMLAQQVALGASPPGSAPGRKRATNVTIDEAVLAEAKKLGINLSQTLEATLREIIRQTRIREWSSTHQAAVGSYNQLVGGIPETTA
jgi:antitoxin CcdA